jgi:membrane-associated phospholipid phosphatase
MISQKFKNAFIILLTIIFSVNGYSQSPYKLSLSKEIPLVGSGFVLGGISQFIHERVSAFTMEQISGLSIASINKFDRSAIYNYSLNLNEASDVLVGVSIGIPSLLFIDSGIRNDWQTISTIYFETAIFATFIPRIVKMSSERTRPFVYNSIAPLDKKLESDARHSFFSGHTTWAFASAVFLSTVYEEYFPSSPWRNYIWTGSLLMAGTIGYLRYEAGYHFPSDIIVGAAVGTAIGYIVPVLHKSKNSSITISPFGENIPGKSISVSYNF